MNRLVHMCVGERLAKIVYQSHIPATLVCLHLLLVVSPGSLKNISEIVYKSENTPLDFHLQLLALGLGLSLRKSSGKSAS